MESSKLDQVAGGKKGVRAREESPKDDGDDEVEPPRKRSRSKDPEEEAKATALATTQLETLVERAEAIANKHRAIAEKAAAQSAMAT